MSLDSWSWRGFQPAFLVNNTIAIMGQAYLITVKLTANMSDKR